MTRDIGELLELAVTLLERADLAQQHHAVDVHRDAASDLVAERQVVAVVLGLGAAIGKGADHAVTHDERHDHALVGGLAELAFAEVDGAPVAEHRHHELAELAQHGLEVPR